jgi:hypothetical protein
MISIRLCSVEVLKKSRTVQSGICDLGMAQTGHSVPHSRFSVSMNGFHGLVNYEDRAVLG